MNVSNYGCKFSVLAVPKHTEMFMMNMAVYDVVPHSIESNIEGHPVSVVWCAVFNLASLKKS